MRTALKYDQLAADVTTTWRHKWKVLTGAEAMVDLQKEVAGLMRAAATDTQTLLIQKVDKAIGR